MQRPSSDQNKEKMAKSSGEDELDDLVARFDPLLASSEETPKKEVKVKLSFPATNVKNVVWGEVVHNQVLSGGNRLVVCVHTTCQLLQGGPEEAIPDPPVAKPLQEKKEKMLDPFADIPRKEDSPLLSLGASLPPSGFALAFVGADPSRAHWLQFIRREMVVSTILSETLVTEKIPMFNLSNEPIILSTPDKPHPAIDASSKDSPYYDMHPKAAKVRKSTYLAMIDIPGGLLNELPRIGESEAFLSKIQPGKGGRVLSRAYFDTFLYIDDRPCYHIDLLVEWMFDEKFILRDVQHRFRGGRTVETLPKELQALLSKK